MSFPNRVIFQQNQSQLGRPPVNNDYISGLNFYGPYPSGGSFNSGNQTIPFLSLNQAESAGITNTYSDETQATFNIPINEIGSTGNSILIQFAEPLGIVVTVVDYTQLSSNTSPTILANSIVSAINANSINNGGYTAAYASISSVDTVVITVRKGLGIFPNTGTPLTATLTGSIEIGTITKTITGVASKLAVWYYHISEYFRLMPNGKVFVTIRPSYPVANSGLGLSAFGDIITAQAFAQGAIRQFGVYQPGVTATADELEAVVTAAKAAKTVMFNNNQPAEVWLGMDIVAATTADDVSDVANLPDLSGLDCAGIGVVVGQDGAAQGYSLFQVYGYSITTLGATLGATSSAAVNIDIGWVQQFNITDGTELNVPAFANGQLYSTVFSNENNALTQVDNYRYCFIMNYSGLVGTYFNDDKTATSSTDSFANMNDNRTIDKVQRVVYANLLPLVNGPIDLNADGTLSTLTLANLDSLARNPMELMAAAGEIAGDANGNLAATAVQINPNQNVVANNGITITVQPTENGTARQILVPIGYAN